MYDGCVGPLDIFVAAEMIIVSTLYYTDVIYYITRAQVIRLHGTEMLLFVSAHISAQYFQEFL